MINPFIAQLKMAFDFEDTAQQRNFFEAKISFAPTHHPERNESPAKRLVRKGFQRRNSLNVPVYRWVTMTTGASCPVVFLFPRSRANFLAILRHRLAMTREKRKQNKRKSGVFHWKKKTARLHLLITTRKSFKFSRKQLLTFRRQK